MLYYIQPKKAVEVLFTIRSTSNDLLNEHVVVMRIVSGMKKLLHFSNQLLLVAIHQCLYTSLYSSRKGQIHRWSHICHILSWCDLPCVWGSIAVDHWWEIARRMWKLASSTIQSSPQTGITHKERTHVTPTSVTFNLPWYTAWWIVFRHIYWSNYYTIYIFRMLKGLS